MFRAGHVAHSDAARARRIEVDRVDADAELLDQLQARSLLDPARRHPLEHVEQHVRILHFASEGLLVGLFDDRDAQPVVLERRNRRPETRAWRDTAERLSCSPR